MVMPEGTGIPPKKQWTASEMGKVGGPLGGRARMASLSKRKRIQLARKAARARWDRVKKDRPQETV